MADKLVSTKAVVETFRRYADRIRKDETDYSEEKLEELRLALEGCLALTPDAQGGQTADEMLQKLGYASGNLFRARSGYAMALYEKDTGDHFYEIEVVGGAPGGDIAFDTRVDGCESCLLGTEALACAQLIREMQNE